MKNYDTTLMLISLKYCKEVLNTYGELQKDGSFILENRKYIIKGTSVISEPINLLV